MDGKPPAQEMAGDQPRLPWELGVFDAHCHPTDTMASIAHIPLMKATSLTVMATRGEDQDLVAEVAVRFNGDLTAETKKVIPCFGWHPWFAHQIAQDDMTTTTKAEHYRRVLTGTAEEDAQFFKTLPDPKPLSTLLAETRMRLLAHPDALVGEIGLDKAFRLPMPWQQHEVEGRDVGLTPGSREGRRLSPYRVSLDHQRAVLKAQLQLAGELRRAVSVHSVQAHGAVFDILQDLWKGHELKQESRCERKQRKFEETYQAGSNNSNNQLRNIPSISQEDHGPLPYPPRVCMHSYSGPPDPLKQYLRPGVPSQVYFSFSAVINFTKPSADKVAAVLKALPDERILVESDLHCAGSEMDQLLEEVIRTICRIRGWSLEDGVKKLADNWKRFVFG